MLDSLFLGLGFVLIAIWLGSDDENTFLVEFLPWLLPLWLFGYRPLSTLLVNGTPAKQLLGMYVGDRAGYPLSTIRVLGRELTFLAIRIVPFGILANVIFLLFSPAHRGFHDLAASSDVYLDP